MLGSSYPLLNIFWSMLEFFLFFLWIFLIIMIFMDIFRSHDLKGFSKFLWVLFIIVLPFLGAFLYLIVRGGGMHERQAEQARLMQKAYQSAMEQAGNGTKSTSDELAKLTELKSQGAITDEEFQKAKAKLLG